MDEMLLVSQAKRGDTSAFDDLVRAYQGRAYAVAYGFVRNRDDALELAQDAFARAYRAMPRFNTQMPFYPWLYRIIKNVCLNHLKRRRRRGETSLDSMMASGHQVTDRTQDPERDASLSELRQAIALALDELSPEHREILVLRHFQQLAYAEIAACLDIPQGTVMSRLHAARRSLRDVLERAQVSV